jgi:LPS-assembly lipoprotein
MSWSRRGVLLGGTLALAACGFSPVYAPGGAGSKLFGQIRAADPKTPDEFTFAGRIAERLGPDRDARFALAYKLRVAVVAQAITKDEVTTRYSLNGTANFVLTDSASGAEVTRGQVSTFTSYSTTGTTIATMAAEQDAHDRLARMLADQVVTRLLAVDPASLQ